VIFFAAIGLMLRCWPGQDGFCFSPRPAWLDGAPDGFAEAAVPELGFLSRLAIELKILVMFLSLLE
jgi:hypothetical protein